MNRPLQDWLEFAGLSAAAAIVRVLSFEQLRPIADALGSLVYWLDPRGRATALANLEAAFPGKYTCSQKRTIARGSYRTFARTMLELLWAPNLTRESLSDKITISGLDDDPSRLDPDRAVIYCCMHSSNFEWLSFITSLWVTPLPVVAQKFRNPDLAPIFDKLRSVTGNNVIPQERAMVKMLKLLQRGGKFGLLIDLNIRPSEGAVPIETFGGLLASVTPAHVALAQRTNALIVPVECQPLSDGRYQIIYHKAIECPADASTQALVQQCWNTLEHGIHSHPENWLWPYKHWRYKPSRDNERYPFYANESGAFEEMISKSRGGVQR